VRSALGAPRRRLARQPSRKPFCWPSASRRVPAHGSLNGPSRAGPPVCRARPGSPDRTALLSLRRPARSRDPVRFVPAWRLSPNPNDALKGMASGSRHPSAGCDAVCGVPGERRRWCWWARPVAAQF
jgi:hypothetical protein